MATAAPPGPVCATRVGPFDSGTSCLAPSPVPGPVGLQAGPAREGIRQVGGWGGAVIGMKIGGTVGAAVGIETGPGAILTGAVGAVIFGTAGYLGADWVANWAVK